MQSKAIVFGLILCLVAAQAGLTAVLPQPASAGATLAVVYVDEDATGAGDGSSWDDAYTDLQVALAAAPSGSEFWVAEGFYLPGPKRTDTFQLVSRVALYGGFSGVETDRDQRDWLLYLSILTGDIATTGDASDNVYHVVTGSGTDSTAVLDGFYVVDGYADGPTPQDRGGGMYSNGGNPTLTDVLFSSNYASNAGGGMYNETSNPTLSGVIFRGNAANWSGGGMHNSNSQPTLVDVTFKDNTAYWGGGLYNDGSGPTLTNAAFTGNQGVESGGGVYNLDSDPVLVNVMFSGNTADWGGGVANHTNSHPTLINATFSGNVANYGGGLCNLGSEATLANAVLWGNDAPKGAQIYRDETSTAAISYSLIAGSGGSSGWDDTLGADGGGNIDGNPTFVRDPDDGGDGWGGSNDDFGDLRLQGGSPAIDAGDNNPNTIFTDLGGNPRWADVVSVPDTGLGAWPIIDMGSYERPPNPIYVSIDSPTDSHGSSWEEALRDLQDALTWAMDGVEIWVARGTYLPTGTADVHATFELASGVEVYGGFATTETLRTQRDWVANPTILSGDIGQVNVLTDNVLHVVTGSGVTETAVLDGFSITRGFAFGTSGYEWLGAGAFIHSASPTLSNLIFLDNSAAYQGGGMYSVSGNPRMTNVIFSGNMAGYGGGLYASGGNPSLANAVFSGNTGSSSGGGMYVVNGSATLTNMTFSGNMAEGGGGGLIIAGTSSTTLANSILWGNTPDQMLNEDANPTITYSLVQDGCPTGAVCDAHLSTSNPQFVDADGADNLVGTVDDDVRLQGTSPAIDAGDNSAVPADVTDLDGDSNVTELLPLDLDGRPRFMDVPSVTDTGSGTPPIADMGAYEHEGEGGLSSIYLPLAVRNYAPFTNGGFEDGWAGWTQGGSLPRAITSAVVHADSYATRLGNPAYNCEGGVPIGSAWIQQTFTVPRDGVSALRIWYRIYSEDSYDEDKYDRFQILVNGAVITMDGNQSGTWGCDPGPQSAGWEYYDLVLNPYLGQNITLRLENVSADDWFNTWTYVDDIHFLP